KDTVNKINKIVMQYEEVQGINNLIVHDYGLGHFVISMHIEGKEGISSDILNDIANEISYKLYIDMGCNATIQTDFLVKDPMIVDEIFTRATKELQKIESDASIINLRIIKSSLHTNVILMIAGSNNLQKIEPKIRDTMEDVVVSVDSSYHVIVKFVI
ncbi:cation transporter dimerization domain-containing protein, partial [Clostridioides difficile]|uniref:cation transporter dimerization domain-containing protein n=1 Tax=Clostridioides difficile TaxID=1496 RepID=UPI003F8D0CE7